MKRAEAERHGGRLRIRLWAPVALYVAAITILSHQPALPVPGGISDRILHALEYAGLAALVARALLGGGRRPSPGLAAAALGGCAAFGALDELHQSFVPGRQAALGDAAADAAGAALALAVAVAIAARRKPAKRGAEPEVDLLGRRECALCDEAERVLGEVLAEFGLRFRKLDVDRDPELARRYGDQVPVVLVNGRKAFKHRVDPHRLRRKLSSLQRRSAT